MEFQQKIKKAKEYADRLNRRINKAMSLLEGVQDPKAREALMALSEDVASTRITIGSIASMSLHEAQEAHKKVFASNASSEVKKPLIEALDDRIKRLNINDAEAVVSEVDFEA